MSITLNRLAKELNKGKLELEATAKAKLKEGQWFLNKWGSISFTPEGAELMRLEDAVPLAVPTVFQGMVKAACPNPRYVEAILETQPFKRKVYCAIPRRLYGRLIGKRIIVHAITDAQGNTSYRHEAC
jgi:hypothetical protein